MNAEKSVFFEEEFVDPFDGEKNDFLVKAEHLMRYRLAADRIKNGKIVYDIACANGYGTKILSKVSEKAIGLDKTGSFLNDARENNSSDNIEYRQADLDKESLSNLPKADYIICFETIEHLEKPEKFLREAFDLLNAGGVLICSVPNRKYDPVKEDGAPKNEFHKHLFSRADITNMLESAGFGGLESLGQPWPNILVNYFHWTLGGLDKIAFKNDRSFERWARRIAYPTKRLRGTSYSFIFIAKK